jgi:hypothetical protein
MVEVIKGTDTLQQVTEVGNITTKPLLTTNGTGTGGFLGFSGSNSLQIGTSSNHSILFYTNNTIVGISNASGLWNLGNSTTIPSAKLAVTSTVGGFLAPTMTTAQKNAISSPAEGIIVYDLTLHKLCFYNGSAWEVVTSL